jgi:cephalosporin hydroxylase
MNENKNYSFEITIESLNKINKIINEMEGKTFHKHTHILYDIRTEFGDKPINYLEIGSYAGCSVSLISSHNYPTNCYSLDLGSPIDPNVVKRNVSKFKNSLSTFEYIQGDSSNPEIISLVDKKLNNLDILFIDGNHTRFGVFNDFNHYSKLVKNGGYICFDDYLDFQYSPDVKGAVDDIVKELNPTEYDIIGLLKYDFLNEYTHMDYNSIFVIKKK